jgi:hypothetical protein
MMRIALLAAGAMLAAEPATRRASPAGSAAADWPQFLGPNRDGVAPGGPKLLDVWPEEGPRLVWKSDRLPQAPINGAGSPVVADGFVYIFACVFLPQSRITPLDAEVLASLGWAPDMPADLAKKVDQAHYRNPKLLACKTNEDVDELVKK